jgi:hypothetical protein
VISGARILISGVSGMVARPIAEYLASTQAIALA